MRLARNLIAGLLLLAGALFAFTGNVGFWIEQTVYDTDNFASTVDRTLEDDDVQLAIAERFTNTLIANAEIEARIQQRLPEGLGFLALPLTDATREFLLRITMRVLDSERIGDVRDTAVRAFHERLIAVIEDESGAIEAEAGTLVIDLRPILEEVIADISGRDVEIPEDVEAPEVEIPQDVLDQLPEDIQEQLQDSSDGGLLGGLELPEDAGRFVIEDKAVSWIYVIARYGDDAVYIVIGIAVAILLIAIAVSTDRRSMLRNVGITLIVVGVLSLALIVPVRIAGRELANSPDAAIAIINILTEQFRYQSFVLVGVGLVVSFGAALAGPTSIARGLRSQARRSISSTPSTQPGEGIADVIGAHAGLFRLGGMVTAALLLIAWPDPTARVYLTILGLLALYLATIWLVTSDGASAVRARDRASNIWRERFVEQQGPAPAGEPGWKTWLIARAPWLRLIGIALVAVLLLIWPAPTLGSLIALIALLLVYLAAIEFLTDRTSEAAPPAP
jgi:hypothetical protein